MKKTNRTKIRIVSAVLTLCLAFSCLMLSACSESDTSAPDGMVNIASDKASYSFFVPTTWTFDEGQTTPSAYYSSHDTSNVSVMFFTLEHSDDNLDTWWNSFEKEFNTVYHDYSLVSTEKTTLGGLAAVKKVFKGTLDLAENENEKNYEYEFLQVATIKKEVGSAPQVYVFTYTSVTDSSDGTEKGVSYFDSHLDDVQMMIDNFRFR